MTVTRESPIRWFVGAFFSMVLFGQATVSIAQVPIIQPGAPGNPVLELSAEEAIEIADTSYSLDDVRFIQDMIPHHNQALQMAELVADRTNRPELVDAAGRIDASQQDEIAFMQQWLRDRGERVPNPTAHDAMHTDHTMAGMATPQQMEELAQSEGTDFDRMFLQLMITHHEGAVTMVEELLEQPGAAYDPTLFEFTTDVTNDQTAEIERMNALLGQLAHPTTHAPVSRPGSTTPARPFSTWSSLPRCQDRPGSLIRRILASCRPSPCLTTPKEPWKTRRRRRRNWRGRRWALPRF